MKKLLGVLLVAALLVIGLTFQLNEEVKVSKNNSDIFIAGPGGGGGGGGDIQA